MATILFNRKVVLFQKTKFIPISSLIYDKIIFGYGRIRNHEAPTDLSTPLLPILHLQKCFQQYKPSQLLQTHRRTSDVWHLFQRPEGWPLDDFRFVHFKYPTDILNLNCITPGCWNRDKHKPYFEFCRFDIIWSKFSRPQFISASTWGRSVLPKSVTEYSVRGGTSGKSFRQIMPSMVNWRSTCDSTFSDTDGMSRYSSLKRTGWFLEIFTRTTSVHLLPSHSRIGAALQYL